MSAPSVVKTAVLAAASVLVATEMVDAAEPLPAADGADRETAPAPGALRPRAAVVATTAFGMPGVDFVNQLAGARFELEYTPRFALGLCLSYANLKGKDGRAHNVLPEISVGYRAPFGRGTVGVPVRLSGGYLPKNGPTLRLGAGLGFALDDSLALELIVVEPMVWIARERPELSLNLGAGMSGRF